MRRRLVTFVLVSAATAFLSSYWLYEGDLGRAFGGDDAISARP